MSSTVGLQGLWEKSDNPAWQQYWAAKRAQPEPAGEVDGMGRKARRGEVLRTTSRQLMNQVASLPLHVGFKHIFILLQLDSYSLGFS